jgi:hypothetical protein
MSIPMRQAMPWLSLRWRIYC